MSECLNWETIIPNFREGDIIRPFESVFKARWEWDYIFDGGINHHTFLESCAAIERKDTQKVGVYDKNGEQILPEEFDDCQIRICNSENFYVTAIEVKKDGFCGLYDQKGNIIVPVKFKSVRISDNVVIVEDTNCLYGVFALDGKQIINCEYNSIEYRGSLDEGSGYAIVNKEGKCGIISENGITIVPIEYKFVTDILGSFLVMDINSESYGYYSRSGKGNIPCIFKKITEKFETIEVETHDGLIGAYSYKMKEILPPNFKTITYMEKYIIGISENDEISIYNWDGKFLYCTNE